MGRVAGAGVAEAWKSKRGPSSRKALLRMTAKSGLVERVLVFCDEDSQHGLFGEGPNWLRCFATLRMTATGNNKAGVLAI